MLYQGHGWLSLWFAIPLAASLPLQWRQPWLGFELILNDAAWTWCTLAGKWPVRVRRSNLALPLVTLIELESLAGRRSWRLKLFHDSVPAPTLRQLHRLIRVQR